MTIEQKLREKIKRDAEEYIKDYHSTSEFAIKCQRHDFIIGAELLLPLLVEAYEALKQYDEYRNGFNVDEAHHELCCQVPAIAQQAIEKIEKFVGDE